jgi:hypothetical protein
MTWLRAGRFRGKDGAPGESGMAGDDGEIGAGITRLATLSGSITAPAISTTAQNHATYTLQTTRPHRLLFTYRMSGVYTTGATTLILYHGVNCNSTAAILVAQTVFAQNWAGPTWQGQATVYESVNRAAGTLTIRSWVQLQATTNLTQFTLTINEIIVHSVPLLEP